MCVFCPSVYAGCIDVVDLDNELPASITSRGNTHISYQYDLEKDTYTLSWQQGDRSAGPFGPFALTMSCGTPVLKWESPELLLFGRGCGTFCWYLKVFSLFPDKSVPDYQKIERPLAFDSDRNLIAYYQDQDLIHVKNLLSGYEQAIPTVEKCQFRSGLCIADVTFRSGNLEYSWRMDSTGRIRSVPLDESLFVQ